MKGRIIASQEYRQFVASLKARVLSARTSAARAVNRDMILLYWDIGRGIAEKQETLGWGEAVVETLARDLRRAFPETTGFSAFNLWRMRQFYAVYASSEFLAQLVPEMRKKRRLGPPNQILAQAVPELLANIPWGHHVELLKKVKDHKARLYYVRAAAQFGWSRDVLMNQIKARVYERSLRAGKAHNFPRVLPEHLAYQAEEALKSSYNLEFLGIDRTVKERELEDGLIRRVQQFILELGYGFCFVGRQHRLTLGQKEYFIDLLFYHRFLKALVAFELKLGTFIPEFAGKMDFYLNLLNEKERAPDDNPSIGIILCAEKDNLEVEYSLKTKSNPIGVAEYKLVPRLPKELKGKLPSERELMAALRDELRVKRKR